VNGKELFQDDTKLIAIAQAPGKKGHAAPTGQIFNGESDEFIVQGEGISGGSKFIFVTEDGTISGWTENKDSAGNLIRQTKSVLTVDNSKKGAIYKGVALSTGLDENLLYAADFANKRIDIFNADWEAVKLERTAFQVPTNQIPASYGPFNIQTIGDKLYVAYALTGKERGEEIQGEGRGYVAEFDFDGKLERVFKGHDKLNAPWGIALAPDNYGPASGKLLVGNFGSGRITAFNLSTGEQEEYLKRADGQPVQIEGLWALVFGNGESLGKSNHLYFAAGPQDEKDGVFGKVILDSEEKLY
jgi:uncharacterized protein (TIGR03118 family)